MVLPRLRRRRRPSGQQRLRGRRRCRAGSRCTDSRGARRSDLGGNILPAARTSRAARRLRRRPPLAFVRHAEHMQSGNPLRRTSPTMLRNDWDQVSTGPTGLRAQSVARILAPISPPPRRQVRSAGRRGWASHGSRVGPRCASTLVASNRRHAPEADGGDSCRYAPGAGALSERMRTPARPRIRQWQKHERCDEPPRGRGSCQDARRVRRHGLPS